MWERPVNRKLVAGVASGISEGMGIAKVWVRLGFIVLVFMAGVGFILYGIGWLVMPQQGADESIVDRLVDRANEPKEWVSIGLVVLGVLLLAGNLQLISSDIIFAGGLIAIGIVLYTTNARDTGDDLSPSGGSPPEVTTPADVGEDAGDELGSVDVDAPAEAGASTLIGENSHPMVSDRIVSEAVSAGVATLDRPTRQRSARSERRSERRTVLPRFTGGALLLVLGGMGMYHASGGFVKDIDYAAVALGIVGIGVLVSSMWGRARWLVPLGLALMPIVLVANLINVSVIGPWGNFFVEAQTIENLNQSYRYGGGDVKFRLGEDAWVSVSEDVSVEVSLGMGSLALFVPKDVNVVVTTDIGLGTFEIWPNRTSPQTVGDFDRLTHGQDSATFVAGEQRIYRQSGFPGPTLKFNASVGLGNMSIYQMEGDQ